MKFRTRFISACALSLALSACSTPQLVEKPRQYQQNLLVKCPVTLSQLTDGTGADVSLTMAEWAATYHDCAARHNGLVEAVKP